MYASLIASGASTLYDLFKDATAPSSATSATNTSFKPPPDDSSSSSTSTASSTGAVKPTATSGNGLSDALQKLFVDLQSASSSTAATAATSTTDATGTIASDLQSVAGAMKSSHAHGHHGGPPPGPPPDESSQSSNDGTSSSGTGTSGQFTQMATSLLAYAKTQSLSSASTSSLTA